MAGRLFVFAIVSAVAMVSISAVGSAANFRAMMEQDVKEIEKRLKLAGDKLAEVNKILTKACASSERRDTTVCLVVAWAMADPADTQLWRTGRRTP